MDQIKKTKKNRLNLFACEQFGRAANLKCVRLFKINKYINE